MLRSVFWKRSGLIFSSIDLAKRQHFGHFAANGGNVRRILVIDPANLFIQYVELVVDRYGYDIKGVGSAREALLLLAQETFDLVLAQEALPDMEWYEFSRKIRSDTDHSDIPVVVLCPDPERFDDPGCCEITIAKVRTKPVSMRDLIGVIQEHLPYQNRRRGIRAPLAMKALIYQESEPVPCQVLNLSEGGVFVMKKNPFPIGHEIHMLFPFQNADEPVEVFGRVAYVVETARGKHPRGMGIQFNEMEPGVSLVWISL